MIKLTKKEINHKINEHEKWVSTNGKAGSQADFSNVDFSNTEVNFINRKLSYAIFTHAILHKIDFTSSQLIGASFNNAVLDQAKFCGANLYNANLQGALLTQASFLNAVLDNANLQYIKAPYATFTRAQIRSANLCDAKLGHTIFTEAKLDYTIMRDTYLGYAYVDDAICDSVDFINADLYNANFIGTDLTNAILFNTQLTGTDLSRVTGLPNAIDFMNKHFKKTNEGYIAYKTFDQVYKANPNWKIEENSIIEETVNHTRTQDCGNGINVAPLKWVTRHTPRAPIYQILIKFEWLTEVCVPYGSDGKIRCGRAMIVKALTKEEEEEILNNEKMD